MNTLELTLTLGYPLCTFLSGCSRQACLVFSCMRCYYPSKPLRSISRPSPKPTVIPPKVPTLPRHRTWRAISVATEVKLILLATPSGLAIRYTGLIEVAGIVDLVETGSEVLARWCLDVFVVSTSFVVAVDVSAHGGGWGSRSGFD